MSTSPIPEKRGQRQRRVRGGTPPQPKTGLSPPRPYYDVTKNREIPDLTPFCEPGLFNSLPDFDFNFNLNFNFNQRKTKSIEHIKK